MAIPRKCLQCREPGTAGPIPNFPEGNLCVSHAAIARVAIPTNPERLEDVPDSIAAGPAWPIIAPVARGRAIWLHQARALRELEQDRNIVIATSTASGKTLVFQSWTMDRLIRNPEATAIIFYPNKALGNDQTRRWDAACRTLDQSPWTVGQINGDVSGADREAVMERVRILIATPDVCHASLLCNANDPKVNRFLRNLSLIVIDEAHTYESVFGSNSAFFFRRLTTAAVNAGNPALPTCIAATATIHEPEAHLQKLTGQTFTEIGEDLNGAPRHPRELLHLPLQSRGKSRESQVAELIRNIIDNDPRAQVIAFNDSRQGVERIVEEIRRPNEVLPYRSGYLSEDRQNIEQNLRENRIRAVISTSALELGIDMPDLTHGINMDIPVTRKQFHQRLGRVGRSQPGTFIILAPENRFRGYGDTLQGYFDNSVEPSRLYLENEYVSHRQAQCLKDELQRAGIDTRVPPDCVEWPEGFAQALQGAHGRAAPHLQNMNRGGGGRRPQLAYSLRTSGEENLEIRVGEKPSERNIGSINIRQAMKEAFPGAVYRHRGRAYRSKSWGRDRETRQPWVRIEPIGGRTLRTNPIMKSIAIIPRGQENIINRWELLNGYAAETRLVVLESIEGYSEDRGPVVMYREMSRQDPRLSRKQREMPTTGLHIRIREDWFRGEHGQPWQARHQIANALRTHLSYRKSVALPDLGQHADNIVLETAQGFLDLNDSILIYDNIHGGMQLTNDLYENLASYARSMKPGMNPEDGSVYQQYIENMIDWAGRDPGDGEAKPPGPGDWWMVVRPESRVSVYSAAAGQPVLGTVTGCIWRDAVIYQISTEDGGELESRDGGMTSPAGGLDFQYWNPEQDIYTEMSYMER